MCNVGNYVKSLFLLLLFSVSISAQSPGGFSYQAIVRNSAGTLVSNRTVSVRIQVLMGSVSGNVVYSENHNVMSNSNGLVTLIVGNGSNVVGSLLDIDWGNGLYFIQTDIDPTGGVNYSISSTSQLLSVPYALHAMRADELSGPVSFNQLTDVPESIGFSGDFEDLTNVPDLFEGDYNALSNVPDLALVATSGSYEDLQDAPVFHAVAASGSYEDLTNKPAFSSVATSGNYNDLQNKPEFAVVAQTGSYTDLTDKPIFFSGSYLDLLDKPNMEDSVNAYGFSGVYNDLIGRPTFSAVAVSGSYNDLTDRPNLSADGSFSGSYADLAGLPSFPDSIAKYGSGGAGGVSDYNQLLNKPNVKDSVERYGFSGSYTDLTDVPSFSSVATTGNYEDLQMLPNIKDSVERYGFNGNYYDLENVPEGRNNGDLMYWDADKNQWVMLSHGKEGDVLMMGADNELKWTNLSYAIRNASKTVFDTLQVLNFPLTNGSINDVNGFIDGNGILEFPAGTDIELIITPAPGYGLASVKLNGTSLSVYDELSSADSLPNYIVEKGVAYLEIENASGNYNIEVEFKQCVLVLTEVVDTFPAVVSTVMIPYGKNYSYTLNKKEGCGIDSIFVDGRNVVSGLSGSVMSLDARADTIYLRVVYKSGLMSVGDAYDWGGANNAYVYEVTDNGFKVVRLFSRITYNWNQLAVISSGLTDGWSTPNNTELSAINEHPNVMNALFTGYDVSNQDVYVWSNTSYGSGNEMAYGINVLEGIVILDVNMPMYVLVVKEVIKN